MSNNAFGSSFSDTYLNACNEEQDVFFIPPSLFFSNFDDLNLLNECFDFYNQTLSNHFNSSQMTGESIQEQHNNYQKIMQPFSEHRSDEEFDRDDENNYIIQVGAIFPNWKSLENALKIYELEVGFKAIKFRMEHDNNGNIIR
ncbi:14999_t:CDS:2 [Cetraspora pellucida]|uniref:14999_t:CDS:1 n=1 Tax=Cetraspora pellucida TaxID=1433469 RepID=A0ACA9LXX8_9GLOM|nr:14999_t:CDS:2 [Cetraspora pellucida]